MRRNPSAVLAVLLTALLLLALASACSGRAPESSDQSPAFTAGASTLIARLTGEAGQTAVAQLTQMAATPTSGSPRRTPPPKGPESSPTPLPAATDTRLPRPPAQGEAPQIPTAVFMTATVPAQPCNRMEFLGDVTAPPDTIFPAGSVFTKAWRVRNVGACTWTAAYALVFTGGNLSSSMQTALPAVTPPGAIVDLSVSLIAPSFPGAFQGTWLLRSDTGELFGYGADASVPLFASIRVLESTIGRGATYDIAANYCAAAWTSEVGRLPCPGNRRDPIGVVQYVEAPALESRQTNEYGLWTRPNQDGDGWISAQTPPIPISDGDHFTTEIGCLNGSPECDVIFQLDYQTTNGATGRLGRWRETYDGLSTYVDVNLSPFAGRDLYLILTVYNRGRARDADAVWLLPRVQSGSSGRINTLVWTRDGQPRPNACDELRVYYTGVNSAVAVAYDCSGGSFELGRTTLNGAQVEQLRRFEDRLANFEGEVYSVSGGNPVITGITFRGDGNGAAGEPDIQALASFAAQIYNQITRPR